MHRETSSSRRRGLRHRIECRNLKSSILLANHSNFPRMHLSTCQQLHYRPLDETVRSTVHEEIYRLKATTKERTDNVSSKTPSQPPHKSETQNQARQRPSPTTTATNAETEHQRYDPVHDEPAGQTPFITITTPVTVVGKTPKTKRGSRSYKHHRAIGHAKDFRQTPHSSLVDISISTLRHSKSPATT